MVKTDPPKTIDDLTIPEKWPQSYKDDYIKNRLHGTSPEYLNANEEIKNKKVVAKPHKPKTVIKADCPVCETKDSYVIEPGMDGTHHCNKCGYWNEYELKKFHGKINKIGEKIRKDVAAK